MPLHQHILIVHGEEAVLNRITRYLRDHGYETTSCASIDSALAHFRHSAVTAGLLVANTILPDGSGIEFGDLLREFAPRLKFIFLTGYRWEVCSESDGACLNRFPVGSVRFLAKSFSEKDLVAGTRELIGPPQKQPLGVLWPGLSDDTPELHQLMRALDHQAGLLELAQDAILVRDHKDAVRFWNRSAETLYGWSKAQIAGRAPHELLQTVFPSPFSEVQRTLHDTGRWEGELVQTRGDGSQVIVSSRWALRDTPDGQREVLEVNRDITAQTRMAEEIQTIHCELKLRMAQVERAEAQFRSVIESAPDAIVITDPRGKILLVNAHTEKFFGYPRNELIGQSAEMLLPERFRRDSAERSGSSAAAPLVSPMGTGRQLFGLRKNGEEFPVEVRLSPLDSNEGLLISLSIRDVSESVRLDRLLNEKNLQLQKLDLTKDMFLAVMSHELRSPLHTIIGFADLLDEGRNGPLNRDQRRYLDHILHDSQHLLNLINDILDLSRLEAGQLQLRPDHMEICEAIAEVELCTQSLLEEKSLRLQVRIDSALAIHADPVRFRQVMLNLLTNAIHSTPKNTFIDISAVRRENLVEFRLRDSGREIPRDEREFVFDKFHQLRRANGGGHGGTGLGLPIARSLIEHHGGRIWLEGEPGPGNCFVFTFPLPQQHAASAAD